MSAFCPHFFKGRRCDSDFCIQTRPFHLLSASGRMLRKKGWKMTSDAACHRIQAVHQQTLLWKETIAYLCFCNRNDCFTKKSDMMKKVLFAAAMMLTMGTTVATSAAEKVSLRGQASVEMDYQTINIKDLPQISRADNKRGRRRGGGWYEDLQGDVPGQGWCRDGCCLWREWRGAGIAPVIHLFTN